MSSSHTGEQPTRMSQQESSPELSGTELAGDETFALRNPLKSTQTIWKRECKTQLEAQKNTNKIKRKRRRELEEAYYKEIADVHYANKQEIEHISQKYGKVEKKAHEAIYYSSSFKTKRKSFLFNAQVHAKHVELNTDAPVGSRLKLKELRNKVKEENQQRECDGKPLTKEEKDGLLKQLEDYRELKETGARANNKSTTQDVYAVTERVKNELIHLTGRTGATSILAIGRGHMNDSFNPTTFESENAIDFYKSNLGYNPTEVMARLECYASTFKQGQMKKQDKGTLRKECAALIGDGLKEITGIKDLAMNYKSYKKLVAHYRVRIVGWPKSLPFANPSAIDVEGLRRLRDLLNSKICKWEQLTGEELANFLAEDGEGNTLPDMVRKEHSDKGKKQAQRMDEEGLTKRQKTQATKAAAQLPPFISPDIIDSDSEDESGSDSGIPASLHSFTPGQLRVFSPTPDNSLAGCSTSLKENHVSMPNADEESPYNKSLTPRVLSIPPFDSAPSPLPEITPQDSASATSPVCSSIPGADPVLEGSVELQASVAPEDLNLPNSTPVSNNTSRKSKRLNGRHVPVYS